MHRCLRTFVFWSPKTMSYLFSLDRYNKFDVILKLDENSKSNYIVTLGKMDELQNFLRKGSRVKMGLSVTALNHNEILSCQPQYGREYTGDDNSISTF